MGTRAIMGAPPVVGIDALQGIRVVVIRRPIALYLVQPVVGEVRAQVPLHAMPVAHHHCWAPTFTKHPSPDRTSSDGASRRRGENVTTLVIPDLMVERAAGDATNESADASSLAGSANTNLDIEGVSLVG